MTLNEKIGEILKRHKEGKEFFNALDFMIRGDKDILKGFYKFAIDNIFINSDINTISYNLVLSGRFGLSLMSNYGSSLCRNFLNVIMTNGNIREDENPEIYNTNFGNKPFIFLDDSFYSGRTRDNIEKALQEINPLARIDKTIVIYDGSLNGSVLSLYKYHKNETKI